MITLPDIVQHNNPLNALVDSSFIRGGGRVVANLTALYALSTNVDQLKERITRVWVTASSAYYILTDIANVSNSSGWTLDTGGATANSYVHTQGIASTSWVIPHNLNFYPNVTVVNSTGHTLVGDITYTSTTSLTLTFSAAITGTAYLS